MRYAPLGPVATAETVVAMEVVVLAGQVGMAQEVRRSVAVDRLFCLNQGP